MCEYIAVDIDIVREGLIRLPGYQEVAMSVEREHGVE